jgi:hypothetical protein
MNENIQGAIVGVKRMNKNAIISKESRRKHVSFADKESLGGWYEKTTFCNNMGNFIILLHFLGCNLMISARNLAFGHFKNYRYKSVLVWQMLKRNWKKSMTLWQDFDR